MELEEREPRSVWGKHWPVATSFPRYHSNLLFWPPRKYGERERGGGREGEGEGGKEREKEKGRRRRRRELSPAVFGIGS